MRNDNNTKSNFVIGGILLAASISAGSAAQATTQHLVCHKESSRIGSIGFEPYKQRYRVRNLSGNPQRVVHPGDRVQFKASFQLYDCAYCDLFKANQVRLMAIPQRLQGGRPKDVSALLRHNRVLQTFTLGRQKCGTTKIFNQSFTVSDLEALGLPPAGNLRHTQVVYVTLCAKADKTSCAWPPMAVTVGPRQIKPLVGTIAIRDLKTNKQVVRVGEELLAHFKIDNTGQAAVAGMTVLLWLSHDRNVPGAGDKILGQKRLERVSVNNQGRLLITVPAMPKVQLNCPGGGRCNPVYLRACVRDNSGHAKISQRCSNISLVYYQRGQSGSTADPARPGPVVICKQKLSGIARSNTPTKARQKARFVWRKNVTRRHGANYANLNAARNVRISCRGPARQSTCRLVATPCLVTR